MKREFVDLLQCNNCSNLTLQLTIAKENSNGIEEGSLLCSRCQKCFPIKEGIPELLSKITGDIVLEIESSEGTAKRRYSEEKDIYNEEYLLSLPYVTNRRVANYGGWIRKVSYFEQVFEMLGNGKGKKILDIGAGTTWATRYFAKMGYDAIALDVVKGFCRGMVSSKTFYKHDNIYYENILAPMENIPIKSETIDVVFSINSFHHARDLNVVFSEVCRVLKADGGVAYIVEDVSGLLLRAYAEWSAKRQRDKHRHYDHAYSFNDYKKAIESANLKMELILPERFVNRLRWIRKTPRRLLSILHQLAIYLWMAGFILKIEK